MEQNAELAVEQDPELAVEQDPELAVEQDHFTDLFFSAGLPERTGANSVCSPLTYTRSQWLHSVTALCCLLSRPDTMFLCTSASEEMIHVMHKSSWKDVNIKGSWSLHRQ